LKKTKYRGEIFPGHTSKQGIFTIPFQYKLQLDCWWAAPGWRNSQNGDGGCWSVCGWQEFPKAAWQGSELGPGCAGCAGFL